MKKLITILSIVFVLSFVTTNQTNAQGVYGIGAHAGYSWLNGVVGGEIFLHKIGVSGGWMPTSMPGSGDKISSGSWAVTFYSQPMDEDSWYLSYGMAMSGYRSEISINSSSYSSGVIKPMNIVMAGWRIAGGTGFNMKLGMGVGWLPEMTVFTGEVTIGYAIPFN